MTYVPFLPWAALAYRGWLPVWVAVVLGVLAIAGTTYLYVRETAMVPLWRRLLLAGFRGLIVASILFLALKPTILTDKSGNRPRTVALLIDNSQSMTNVDSRTDFLDQWRVAIAFDTVRPTEPVPQMPSSGDIPDETPNKPTRMEMVQAVFNNQRLDLTKQLRRKGPLQPATFGSRRSPRESSNFTWIDELPADEPRTLLFDSIYDLLQRDTNELPAAIVLATDGRDNGSTHSADLVIREAARLGVPLHIYGVGGSDTGQVQIRDVAVQDTLFVDDIVAVPVRFRAKGFDKQRIEIVTRLNGREVARKEITAREGDDIRETLTFVPEQRDTEEQRQELTTTVSVVGLAEPVSDEVTKSVRVVDRKLRVLMVDSTPRWDFKFLQRALLRDRRVESQFYLTEGDPRAMRSGPPFIPGFPETRQELFAYDLLILGDVPAEALTTEQQEFVREFVAEGGGLIHIAGRYHAPASFVGTPLADPLPVEVPVVDFPIDDPSSPEPFKPNLTPQGVRSPLLALDNDPVANLRVWRNLKEMYWAYPVNRLKPAAEVLVVHPTRTTTDNKPMPLVASHYYGKGYVLYVGFDETWRWRYNEADKYFGRFWSQAVYLVGVPRTLGTKLTQLSMDTLEPQLGKTGQIYARLLTPELRPLTSERIEARLDRLDVTDDDPDRTTSVELKSIPGQPGEFVATIPFNRTGQFTLTVDTGVEPATLDYRVALPPDHELAPGSLDEDELRELAEGTGGRFYREEDLHALPESVERKTVPFTQREEILLWNEWTMLWLIGLFTAEWFLRKFNSLS